MRIFPGLHQIAASRQQKKDSKQKSTLGITPGSEQVRYTVERDGLIDILKRIGAKSFSQCLRSMYWSVGEGRSRSSRKETQSYIPSTEILQKRNDGNPNTNAFVGSPEMVTAIALSGRLDFNPMTDTLTNNKRRAG